MVAVEPPAGSLFLEPKTARGELEIHHGGLVRHQACLMMSYRALPGMVDTWRSLRMRAAPAMPAPTSCMVDCSGMDLFAAFRTVGDLGLVSSWRRLAAAWAQERRFKMIPASKPSVKPTLSAL